MFPFSVHSLRFRDHPHMRGEYQTMLAILLHGQGSPPHAWGILFLGLVSNNEAKDHPHMRGEYVSFFRPFFAF